MTNEEAKEIVKRIKGYMNGGECWSESEFIAMDMAIKALGQISDIKVIINNLMHLQEDVLRYQMICEVVKE